MLIKPVFKNYSSVITLFSRLTDPFVVVLAACFSFYLRFDISVLEMSKDYKLLILLVFVLVCSLFPLFGLYLSWRGQTLSKQARSILLAWGCVILVTIVFLFALKLSSGYSRLWLGYWAVSGLFLLVVFRMLIYAYLQYQRSIGRNTRYVIILGAGVLGRRVISQVNKSPWMGYKIKAIFDDSTELHKNDIAGCKVVGPIDAVDKYLSKHSIDEIWIALPLRAESKIKKLLLDTRHLVVNIKLIPDFFVFSLFYRSMSEIAGLPTVNLSITSMDVNNRFVKAIEDRVLALIILLAILPIILLVSVGVKLSSPGPVFFKQQRISWNGKKFNILKFRSMPVNDDKNSVWGDAKNKETTKFGAFLRKTSIDELPQFFNVLKGDMSIVGPRPERSEFVEKFKYEISGYMQKHTVKAGITGWAQVNGWRGDTCLKTRVKYDLYYIENWSLLFDLKIVFLTVFKGFVNKNAY